MRIASRPRLPQTSRTTSDAFSRGGMKSMMLAAASRVSISVSKTSVCSRYLRKMRAAGEGIVLDICGHWASARHQRYGFNPDIGAFTQAFGSKHLDASALLIPLVGFLRPEDTRVHSTVEAIPIIQHHCAAIIVARTALGLRGGGRAKIDCRQARNCTGGIRLLPVGGRRAWFRCRSAQPIRRITNAAVSHAANIGSVSAH